MRFLASARPVRRDTPYAWYVAVVLGSIHAVAVLDRFLMGLVVEPMKAEMALSDTQAAILVGPAFFLVSCLFAIPIGLLADIVSRRALIWAGLLIWTLATGAVAFAESFATLFLARSFVGIGEACLLPAGLSLLTAYFSPRAIGRATGVFTVGGTVGKAAAFMAGGLLLAFLMEQAEGRASLFHLPPWRSLFVLACVPGGLLLLILLTVTEPLRPPVGSEKLRLIVEAVRHIADRRQTYGGIMIVASMMIAVTLTLAAWAVSFFVRVHDLPIGRAGQVIGAVAVVGGGFGALLGSFAIDALRARNMQASPYFVLGMSQAMLILMSPFFILLRENTILMIVGYGCIQLTMAAAVPAAFASIQDVTPDRVRGSVFSIIMVAYTLLGGFVGPTLVGILSDFLFSSEDGIANALSFAVLLFAVTGAMIVALTWKGFNQCTAAAQGIGPPLSPVPQGALGAADHAPKPGH